MGKRRKVTDAEALDALGDAVTRAIHRAPESLLVHFGTEKREAACCRMAITVMTQLEGDGWTEGRVSKGGEGLDVAIVTGFARADDSILNVLPDVRRADGRVLDGVADRIGALPSQVALAWIMARGIVPVVGATRLIISLICFMPGLSPTRSRCFCTCLRKAWFSRTRSCALQAF